MSTPIERGASALEENRTLLTWRAATRVVFASIDVDALANAIRVVDGKHEMGAGELATAVRDYLLGGE